MRIRKQGLTDPVKSRNLRKRFIAYEEKMAKELERDGFEIFQPSWVCDRIGIKNGKVYFLEFKQPDQELTVKQMKVSIAAGKSYIIVRKKFRSRNSVARVADS